jgi:hypothetical protein
VTLHFQKPDGTEYPTDSVSTNAGGYFEINYTIPSDKPYGTYFWWAVDDHTGTSSNVFSYDVTTGHFVVFGHTIYESETWYSGGTYDVQGSISVAQGATLTIEQDVTVNVANGVSFSVNGTLKATGTTFTWADGQSQWDGIKFYGAGSSSSRLENCTIEHVYGNWDYYHPGAIYISASSPTITGTTIRNSAGPYGIYMAGGSPVISNSTVSGMTSYGLYVQGNASPTVTGSIFSGNQYGLYYAGTTTLNATNNNWGDPSGPLDDSDDRATGGWYNPNGKGNKVSDNVNYYPWTGSTITQTATPTDLSGAPRYASINLTWNANAEPSLGGYKIYYGSTPGNYGAPVVVGKVTSYKLTGLTNDTPYYFAISSLNSVGAESARTAEITATPINKFAVDLTIAGTGDGSALMEQGGTACNTNCLTLFDPYTAVTLKATKDQYSLFKGWSGACTAPSGDCDLYMDDDKAVTATFDTDKEHSVRIDLPEIKHYPSILDAYSSAATGDIIKAWGTDFTEILLLDKGKTVTLKGGFDSTYSTNSGVTTLHGVLTIGTGSVKIENLIIQ